jgi:hypothetical protein
MKTIKKIGEYLGWTVEFESKNQISFYQYSPAGEDFGFAIEVKGKNNLEEIKKEVRKYVDDFDIEEHVELWLPHRGKGGCPNTIKGLLEDAEAIEEMLEEFAKFLEEGNYENI